MPSDSGTLDDKSPEEVETFTEELGLQFEYNCTQRKDPSSTNVFFKNIFIEGCHSWAQWLDNFKKDSQKAADIYYDNCIKRNYGDSCFKFAAMKLIGKGEIQRDSLLAYQALEHGCKNVNHGQSCLGAGSIIAGGLSSHAPNLSAALPFFEMACKMNVPRSCFHMGGTAMACALKTTDADEAQAMRLKALKAWTRGCESNDEWSCRNVALMYRKGDGIEANQAKVEEFESKVKQLRAAHDELKSQFCQNVA